MSEPGYILAIETSNPSAGSGSRSGVALGRTDPAGAVCLAGIEGVGADARQERDLVEAIDRLCREEGIGPGDLSRIAVSVGPGGYTSVRIAVAVARMIARAVGAQTVPVPSWRVAAEGAEPGDRPGLVCLASKRETTWAVYLPPADPRWRPSSCPVLARCLQPERVEALERARRSGRFWLDAAEPLGVIDAAHLQGAAFSVAISDRHLPAAIRTLVEGSGGRVVEPAFDPAVVLTLSERFPAVPPDRLVPVYPRPPDAVPFGRRSDPGVG